MQRRHFEAIAATIAALDMDLNTRCKVANAFAAMAATQNAKFNWRRFMTACGAMPE
jgi:hypothetical protein